MRKKQIALETNYSVIEDRGLLNEEIYFESGKHFRIPVFFNGSEYHSTNPIIKIKRKIST